jgi:hypothetical protein
VNVKKKGKKKKKRRRKTVADNGRESDQRLGGD